MRTIDRGILQRPNLESKRRKRGKKKMR